MKPLNKSKRKWVLIAATMASGMTFFMGTATLIALPTIQKALNATLSDIQWVVTSYALTLAVLILVSGLLGDHFGRKKIFSYGILTFTAGALLSGFSQNIGQLISFQVLQGLGAAMMVPGSLALINVCFPLKERGKAIGLWSGYSGGIAVFGPLLGGFIVDNFNWHFIFFMIVPFGLLAWLITKKHVPESKNPDARAIDWLGTFYIALALFGISFGLIQGPSKGWVGLPAFSLIIGLTAFILFYLSQKRSKHPIIPLEIFKNKIVVGANIVTFFLYFSLQGLIFFLVLNFQQFQGYSATLAGMGLLPSIIIITFLSGPSGGLADKIGPRTQMILGPLIVALGIASMILPGLGVNYFIGFLPGLILFGGGMALVIAPLTKSALSVSEKFSGVASGLNNAIARVAFLMAVAVMGAVVVSIFSSQLSDNLSPLPAEQEQVIMDQAAKFGEIEIPEGFSPDSRETTERAINNAFLYSFRWNMGIMAMLALLSSWIAYVFIRPKRSR